METRKYRIIFNDGINEHFANKIIMELFGLFGVNAKLHYDNIIEFCAWDDLIFYIKKYLNGLRIRQEYKIVKVRV